MIILSEFPLGLRGGITPHVELRNEFVVQLVYAYLGAGGQCLCALEAVINARGTLKTRRLRLVDIALGSAWLVLHGWGRTPNPRLL